MKSFLIKQCQEKDKLSISLTPKRQTGKAPQSSARAQKLVAMANQATITNFIKKTEVLEKK